VKEIFMSNLMRSEWLKGLLVLVLALMVAQCGSDDGACTDCGGSVPSEPQCVNEDLTAGLYSFRIVDQVKGCEDLFSLLAEFGLIPPGPYSIVLPGYGQLPDGSVTVTLPLPGSPQVTGELSEVSGDIVFTGNGTTQVNIDLPPLPPFPDSISILVNVAGTLCPLSKNKVDTELAITLPQAVPPFTSGGCTIEAKLRGTRQ
jgi:hypothetical protein